MMAFTSMKMIILQIWFYCLLLSWNDSSISESIVWKQQMIKYTEEIWGKTEKGILFIWNIKHWKVRAFSQV